MKLTNRDNLSYCFTNNNKRICSDTTCVQDEHTLSVEEREQEVEVPCQMGGGGKRRRRRKKARSRKEKE